MAEKKEQGGGYLHKLFRNSDRKWMKEQLDLALACSKKTEKQTLQIWVNDQKAALTGALWDQLFNFLAALLTMESLRQQVGVKEEELKFAKNAFDWFTQGKAEGGKDPMTQQDVYAQTCQVLIFKLTVHYIRN